MVQVEVGGVPEPLSVVVQVVLDDARVLLEISVRSTTDDPRDERQRAKDFFQVDSHRPLILAKKPTSLR